MSVINQMLRDLEGRRNGGGGSRLLDSLSLRDGGAANRRDMPAWVWLGALAAAGVVIAVLSRGERVALPDVEPLSLSGIQPPVTVAPAPAAANRISGISWQSGSDNALRLVLDLDNAPSTGVERRAQDNGEIRFVLPRTDLAAGMPLLENDRRFFKRYRIGHRDGAVHLNVEPYPNVSVEWMTVDSVGEGGHSWVLKATAPQAPLKPTVAEEQKPVSSKRVAAEQPGPAPSVQPVKTAASKPDGGANSVKKPSNDARRPEQLYQRALSYLSADRVLPAIAELDNVIGMKPSFHPARELLAGLYLQTGQQTEAFMVLKEGVALAPQHLPYPRMYAEALIRRGRPQQALTVLSQSRAYAGGDAEYQALYAATAQRVGEHGQAIDRYMRALDMQPDNGAWWMGLAISLEADSRVEAAAGAYQSALDTGRLNVELSDYVQSRLKALEPAG